MRYNSGRNRQSLAGIALGSLLLASCADPRPDPEPAGTEQKIGQSVALINEFQTELQGALSTALSDGGPVNAIEVCHSTAPQIADTLSGKSDANIRRIALKNRNAGNTVPDDMALLYRELEKAPLGEDGAPNAVHRETGGSFVYMQAIPMQEQPCAACHGTSVAPQVAAAIAERYPEDSAMGFKAGDMRGAFLVEWPAPQ